MIPVLVDTSVWNHALAVRSEWQSFGLRKWGGTVFEAGGLVSKRQDVPVRESKGGVQAAAIGALRHEFEAKRLSHHTTDVLQIEQLILSLSKKSGESYADVNVLAGVGHDVQHVTLPQLEYSLPADDPMLLVRERLARMSCDPYAAYLKALSLAGVTAERVTQDAWHLHCSHICGVSYFLTCDTSLKGAIKSISDKSLRTALLRVVMLPTELCGELGLEPLSTETFDELSYKLGAFPTFAQTSESKT